MARMNPCHPSSIVMWIYALFNIGIDETTTIIITLFNFSLTFHCFFIPPIHQTQQQLPFLPTHPTVSKKDIKRYRKIWLDMFGDKEMDKEGFKKWIKAIGIFPNLPKDAPIDHLFRSYDRNRGKCLWWFSYHIFISM